MMDPKAMRQADDAGAAGPPGEVRERFAHVLLFTGHMIDRADRSEARFPVWAESRAREAIHAAIASLEWNQAGTTVGLASGASGGDLLFHECCEELGIPTRVLIAMAPDEFEATSVAPAGPEWVERFRKLLARAGTQLRVMQASNELVKGATDNTWERANRWMIEEAERLAPERALLALWDGKAGDGPGGTDHFLTVARARGMRILPTIKMGSVLESSSESG